MALLDPNLVYSEGLVNKVCSCFPLFLPLRCRCAVLGGNFFFGGEIRLLVAARSVAGKEAFYASASCVFLVRQQFLFSASRFFLHFLMRVLLAVTKDV